MFFIRLQDVIPHLIVFAYKSFNFTSSRDFELVKGCFTRIDRDMQAKVVTYFIVVCRFRQQQH